MPLKVHSPRSNVCVPLVAVEELSPLKVSVYSAAPAHSDRTRKRIVDRIFIFFVGVRL